MVRKGLSGRVVRGRERDEMKSRGLSGMAGGAWRGGDESRLDGAGGAQGAWRLARTKMNPLSCCCLDLLQGATITHRQGGFACEGGLTRRPQAHILSSVGSSSTTLSPTLLVMGFSYTPADWPFTLPSDAIPTQQAQTIRLSISKPYALVSVDRFQNHPSDSFRFKRTPRAHR